MKVIFRKFNNGDIIALFPTAPGTNSPATCASYMHVGQHCVSSADLTHCTKPATPEEFAPLLAELKRIGYDDLQIVKRMTSNDYLERRATINRVGKESK